MMPDPQPSSESFKGKHGIEGDTPVTVPLQSLAEPSPGEAVMCIGSGGCKGSVELENAGNPTCGGVAADRPVDVATEPPPPPATTAAVSTTASGEPAGEETIPFTCHVCGLHEQCHYRGARPPFSRSVQLAEPGYVMRDPFSARGAGQLLLLIGSDCALCRRAVCQDAGCSLFYTRRFCLPCARERAVEFPPQLRDKIGA